MTAKQAYKLVQRFRRSPTFPDALEYRLAEIKQLAENGEVRAMFRPWTEAEAIWLHKELLRRGYWVEHDRGMAVLYVSWEQ